MGFRERGRQGEGQAAFSHTPGGGTEPTRGVHRPGLPQHVKCGPRAPMGGYALPHFRDEQLRPHRLTAGL